MFRVGDVVQVNPNWERLKPEHGCFGILQWRERIGKKMIVENVNFHGDGSVSYYIEGLYWPDYMLKPLHTLRDSLIEHNEIVK